MVQLEIEDTRRISHNITTKYKNVLIVGCLKGDRTIFDTIHWSSLVQQFAIQNGTSNCWLRGRQLIEIYRLSLLTLVMVPVKEINGGIQNAIREILLTVVDAERRNRRYVDISFWL
jgi:hypothetical protein